MENVILYHVSNPVFRENILKEGLVPQVGPSYEAHYEENIMGPVIFVSTENDYCSTYDDDRYMIILTKEEFENFNFQIDTEVKNALFTNRNIPPGKLNLIHKGTGENFDWDENSVCNNI